MARIKNKWLFILTVFFAVSAARPSYAQNCIDPIGSEGEQLYNAQYHAMQYCNGSIWVSMGSQVISAWVSKGNDLYYNLGFVGIGTDSPATRLHVVGDTTLDGLLSVTGIITAGNAIRLSSTVPNDNCDAINTGDIRYNPVKQSIEVCNGADWKSSSAGGFNPGSVPFANIDGDLIDDYPNLFWNDATNALTVGSKITFKGSTGNIPTGQLVTMEASSLDNLSDVILSGSTVDQVLKYNGTNWVNASFTLDALANVDVPTPTADDILLYNGTNWVNQAQTWLKSGSDIYYALGNVGIGAAPTQKFDVTGTLQATQILVPDSGVAAGDVFLRIGDESFITDVDLVDTMGIYGGADTTIGNIKLGSKCPVISGANGNLGIGTTTAPVSKLDVEGGVSIGATYSGTTAAPANGAIIEGNVGIGMTAPTAKLEVNGRIKDQTGFVAPAGSMMMFGGSVAPAGWLFCDGSSVSTATYAELFAAIGYNYGGSGGSFSLPDMRAAVARGAGTSVGYTQNVSINLGAKQDDAEQGHIHDSGTYEAFHNAYQPSYTRYGMTGRTSVVYTPNVGWIAVSQPTHWSGTPEADNAIGGASGTPRTANETRMKNVGVNFIIKY